MFICLTYQSECSNRRMCWSSPPSSCRLFRPLFVRMNHVVRDIYSAIRKSTIEFEKRKLQSLRRWQTSAFYSKLYDGMFIYSTHTGRCRHFGSFGAENFGNESFLRLCSGVGIHVKLIFLRWLIGDESLVAVRIRLVAAAVHMGLDLFGDDDENRNEMKTNINQIEERI